MDERQPPPTRNSSRTLAKIAVAVLVVIAIAGIVLATLRGRGPSVDTPVAADSTQGAASSPTAGGANAAVTAAAVAAEAEAGPNQVAFAPGSDALSEPATTKLMKLADTAVKQKRAVTITAKFEASRPDQQKLQALAMTRAAAVRSVLEQNKVQLTRMTTKTVSRAYGEASASELNRVDVELN
jgi:outer membrane protein OmpA-like peptidoglycan-associated protein